MNAPTRFSYRIKDAATALSVSRATIWRYIKSGLLPAQKRGKYTLIPGDALRALVLGPDARRPASQRTAIQGTVYVVACGKMVKIGFTRGPIAKRLRSLKTGAPAPLVLLREIEGTDTLERDLHERWRGYRASGEWFHNAGPVAKWIKEGCPV